MTDDEPQLKKCPFCAELIQSEAVLCRFCKSNLAPKAEIEPAGPPRNRDLTRLVYCRSCGTVETPKTLAPGNFIMEILLWFLFFIPGIIYSIWRITSKYKCCRHCRSRDIIPGTSPEAWKHIQSV